MMDMSFTDADDEEGNGARLDPMALRTSLRGDGLRIYKAPIHRSCRQAVSGIGIELAKVKVWLAD